MEDERKVNVAAEEGDSALLAGDVYLISVFCRDLHSHVGGGRPA